MPEKNIYITVMSEDGMRSLHEIPLVFNLDLSSLLEDSQRICTCKLPRIACKQCHIKIIGGLNKLPLLSPDEKLLLSNLSDVDDNSRLACCLKITPNMNGLILKKC